MFIAVFGRDTENIFVLLHQAKRDVEINAEAYIEEYLVEPAEDQESRNRRVKLRANMFASPGMIGEQDDAGKKLREFREQIESRCRGIVERTFSAREKKNSK
jgi:hypothetical protein